MGFTVRGGFPVSRRITVETTGAINGGPVADEQLRYDMPAWTSWLDITASTNPVRVYFEKDDFDTDANWLQVASHFAGPVAVRHLWFRGDGGQSVVDLLMIARG